MHPRIAALTLSAAVAQAASDPLPAASVALRIEAPDESGPWKMVVTNEGDVALRLAADGRLLSLEIEPPETQPAAGPTPKAAPKVPPKPIVCRLPPELRPSGVVDDRAVVLGPHTRYEEIFSPVLYCFDSKMATALAAGATVTAKLGFSPPASRAAKKVPLDPPFVAEPLTRLATVAAVKEITSVPIVLPPRAPSAGEGFAYGAGEGAGDADSNAPYLELYGPARVDAASELTIGVSLTVKNTGGRPTAVHVRRDNLVIDVDGPSGTAQCKPLSVRRRVPPELFGVLRPGNSRELDVWVGEMCPDVIFDRPGLYRIRPTLTFPNATDDPPFQSWKSPIRTNEPILVRILRGRLPFYADPPQILGGAPPF